MEIKIALAGNPNCGKTTMFNVLTGSSQYVGNWPGVTVEKKDGRLRDNKDVIIQDLPGIYSLSPYTPEEIVSRDYLVFDRPDVIINIVDATNIERNLYLSTQLMELNIPVVIALNMIDLVRKRGERIDVEKLSTALGCEVIETSALKGEGLLTVAKRAIDLTKAARPAEPLPVFDGVAEHSIAHIEESIEDRVDGANLRWFAIKLFEHDERVIEQLKLDEELKAHIDGHIRDCENALDDDAESIISNQRYNYIQRIVEKSVRKKHRGIKMSTSDRIDRLITNRWLALPIFAAVMFMVYFVSVTTIGTIATDFMNDTLFGEWILPNLTALLEGWGVAGWLVSLISDGIIGGVGAVLGFVPQMLVLFFMLALLEDVGYMARVAFIMDRVFKKFGLSGKSFIPMLIGSGCSVPGIMASRTIENEADRRMTIITTSFIPCGAKMPIVGLIAGALFGGAWWVAPTAYFIGMAAVILSGIILKKTKPFRGESAPFVMELPDYHVPSMKNVLRSTGERGWSFVKRAGTVILAASVVIWFLSSFGFVDGTFMMVEDMDHSILALIGGIIAPIFTPLGFGNWQSSVATIMGLVAKEEVVSVFGVLYGTAAGSFATHFTQLSAFSFLIFNLLCAPCFAAMGAIKREMNSARWTLFAIAYLCVFAYAISLIAFQLGSLFSGSGFTFGTAAALFILVAIIFLVFRKPAKRRGRA